jgi:N-carbamoylputrescine amidase
MEAAALLAETHIRQAASRGAQIICLPELFLTPYFCRTQESTPFALAESIPGPSTERFQTLAKELGVVLILSLFERRGAGVFHNTAVILDADGQQLGLYRKSHIPQDPGFEEKFYFTPGDTGFRAWDTAYGRIAVLICWDQWFPEAARLAALQDARILFYPTAIGSIPQDPPEQQARHLKAWQRVQQGHAVANSCYVATVNRIGMEGTTRFWGHSFVSDYCGEKIAFAGEEESILLAECDQEAMAEHRTLWPYFRDRRPDLYGGLLDVGP